MSVTFYAHKYKEIVGVGRRWEYIRPNTKDYLQKQAELWVFEESDVIYAQSIPLKKAYE